MKKKENIENFKLSLISLNLKTKISKFINYKAKMMMILILFILIISFIILKKEIKVGLCIIGKKENLYAEEYLNYYIGIGFDHIFIYDNNDIGDENFEDLLKDYKYRNKITIINFRGLITKEGFIPQFNAYYDCYENNKREYNWLSFFDFDEFIELKNNITIKEYLSDSIFDKCDNIKINWLFYSDNEKIYYEKKSIFIRFTKPLLNDSSNVSTKSIVKGKLKINYWYNMHNPHTTSLPYTSCNSIGKIMSRKSHYNSPPNYEKALLRHYATKSLEEYCNKIKRGYPDHLFVINKVTLKKRFDYYFERNKKNTKKIEYIKKIFNYDYK